MAYSTVKAHGGTLEIDSALGEGTRIIMRFPRIPGETEPVPDPTDAKVRPAPAMDILLVDDDELIQASLAPMLRLLGHRVHVAASGVQAIHHLESGLPADLTILDHNMPGLTGADLLPSLLKLRPNLSVVIATGFRDASLDEVLSAWPEVHCLKKPFSVSDLRRLFT
jgi:DNA-binding NtrC family response regulator